MSIDLQNLAQFGIKQVQKIASQAVATPFAKLDMPNDSFGGKILDTDGIEAIMKKLDLMIAQAKEHLEEAERKYNLSDPSKVGGKGRRAAYLEYKKAQTALGELLERKAKHEETPELVQRFLDEQAKAPNTSFLYDPLLSFAEKKAILGQKPEIKKLSEIYGNFPSLKSINPNSFCLRWFLIQPLIVTSLSI